MNTKTIYQETFLRILTDNVRCAAAISELKNRRKFLIKNSVSTIEVEELLLLNRMKIKENMRATQVALACDHNGAISSLN